jgi:hypothetical protein
MSTGADVGNSAVYETSTALVPTGAVGIGTTTPADLLHLRFTNTNGAITGLAVQNMGNTPASYSGMLFYDQLGTLQQFQGFNNVTHEYRIRSPSATSGELALEGQTRPWTAIRPDCARDRDSAPRVGHDW